MSENSREKNDGTDQFENRDFHHTLLKVRRLVLDDLDCDDLMRVHILTLDDLSECTLTENIENQISIMA